MSSIISCNVPARSSVPLPGFILQETDMNGMTDGKRQESAKSQEKVKLNVGGTIFVTYKRTLVDAAGTRLASIREEDENFDAGTGEYFFDRNPVAFAHVLEWYRTGELHFPHGMCHCTLRRELAFWGVKMNELATCCWIRLKEYEEEQKALEKITRAYEARKPQCDKISDISHKNVYSRVKHKIWLIMEDHGCSITSKIWVIILLALILVSIFTLCFETHHIFRVNLTDVTTNATNSSGRSRKMHRFMTTMPHPSLQRIDLATNVIFTMELLIRMIAAPSKVHFWKCPFNWNDCLCVTVQWMVSAMYLIHDARYLNKAVPLLEILGILKIFRIFRIFRLVRHYKGLHVLVLSLKESSRELILLFLLMLFGMVLFSALVFYAEMYQDDTFANIPVGFWWAIITMTTVGYGDIFPKSTMGYIVGSLCAIAGILATSLPIPIVANNFYTFYTVARTKACLDKRKEY